MDEAILKNTAPIPEGLPNSWRINREGEFLTAVDEYGNSYLLTKTKAYHIVSKKGEVYTIKAGGYYPLTIYEKNIYALKAALKDAPESLQELWKELTL